MLNSMLNATFLKVQVQLLFYFATTAVYKCKGKKTEYPIVSITGATNHNRNLPIDILNMCNMFICTEATLIQFVFFHSWQINDGQQKPPDSGDG